MGCGVSKSNWEFKKPTDSLINESNTPERSPRRSIQRMRRQSQMQSSASLGSTMSHVSEKHLSRCLRVYFASTFADFQSEKSRFFTSELPAMQPVLRERHVHFIGIDFRWGVKKEMLHQRCIWMMLSEIDRCDVFVCSVGARYGPLVMPDDPAENDLRAAFKHASRFEPYSWIGEYADRSVFELEVRHAALNNPDKVLANLFYFRSEKFIHKVSEKHQKIFRVENVEAHAKLLALKHDILETGEPVKMYLHPPEFAKNLRQDLTEIITIRWEKSKPEDFPPNIPDYNNLLAWPYELKVGKSLQLVNKQIGRLAKQAAAYSLTESSDVGGVVLLGPNGCGRSWTLSAFCKSWTETHPGDLVIALSGRSHGASSSVIDVLYRIGCLIRDRYGLEYHIPGDVAEMVQELPTWIALGAKKAAVDGEHLVIVIDDIDVIDVSCIPPTYDPLIWLPRLFPSNVVVVASANGTSHAGIALKTRRTWRATKPADMKPKDTRECITTLMKLWSGFLTEKQIEEILGCPQSKGPIYAFTLTKFLCHMGIVDEQSTQAALAPNVQALVEYMLDLLESIHERDYVEEILSLIACSRRGLSEAELSSITAAPPGVFCPVFLDCQMFLMEHMGVLTFAAGLFRETVMKRYCNTPQKRVAIRKKIATYFQTSELVPAPRKLDEVVFALLKSDQSDGLLSLMTELESFEVLFTSHKEYRCDPQRLLQDWIEETKLKSDTVQSLLLKHLSRFNGTNPPPSHELSTSRTRLVAEFLRLIGSEEQSNGLFRRVAAGKEKIGRIDDLDYAASLQRVLGIYEKQILTVNKALYDLLAVADEEPDLDITALTEFDLVSTAHQDWLRSNIHRDNEVMRENYIKIRKANGLGKTQVIVENVKLVRLLYEVIRHSEMYLQLEEYVKDPDLWRKENPFAFQDNIAQVVISLIEDKPALSRALESGKDVTTSWNGMIYSARYEDGDEDNELEIYEQETGLQLWPLEVEPESVDLQLLKSWLVGVDHRRAFLSYISGLDVTDPDGWRALKDLSHLWIGSKDLKRAKVALEYTLKVMKEHGHGRLHRDYLDVIISLLSVYAQLEEEEKHAEAEIEFIEWVASNPGYYLYVDAVSPLLADIALSRLDRVHFKLAPKLEDDEADETSTHLAPPDPVLADFAKMERMTFFKQFGKSTEEKGGSNAQRVLEGEVEHLLIGEIPSCTESEYAKNGMKKSPLMRNPSTQAQEGPAPMDLDGKAEPPAEGGGGGAKRVVRRATKAKKVVRGETALADHLAVSGGSNASGDKDGNEAEVANEGNGSMDSIPLGELLPMYARVLKFDKWVIVKATDVEVGDVVMISKGEKAPADIRITCAEGLQVDNHVISSRHEIIGLKDDRRGVEEAGPRTNKGKVVKKAKAATKNSPAMNNRQKSATQLLDGASPGAKRRSILVAQDSDEDLSILQTPGSSPEPIRRTDFSQLNEAVANLNPGARRGSIALGNRSPTVRRKGSLLPQNKAAGMDSPGSSPMVKRQSQMIDNRFTLLDGSAVENIVLGGMFVKAGRAIGVALRVGRDVYAHKNAKYIGISEHSNSFTSLMDRLCNTNVIIYDQELMIQSRKVKRVLYDGALKSLNDVKKANPEDETLSRIGFAVNLSIEVESSDVRPMAAATSAALNSMLASLPVPKVYGRLLKVWEQDEDFPVTAASKDDKSHMATCCVRAPFSHSLLLSRVSHILNKGRPTPITPEDQKVLLDTVSSLQDNGETVIMVLEKEVEASSSMSCPLDDYTLLGLISLGDTLGAGTAEVVEACRDTGTKLVAFTRSSDGVAKGVATRSGIIQTEADRRDKVLNVSGWGQLTRQQWDMLTSYSEIVVCGASPHHKVDLIRQFRSRGHVVMCTGHPSDSHRSLLAADIGVVLGASANENDNEWPVRLTNETFVSLVDALDEARYSWGQIVIGEPENEGNDDTT